MKAKKSLKELAEKKFDVLNRNEMKSVTGGDYYFYWVCNNGATGQGSFYESWMCGGSGLATALVQER